MKHYYFGFVGALLITISDATAGAGQKSTDAASNEVTILSGGLDDTPSTYGAQGFVRRTTDQNQYIGCRITGTTVYCSAKDANTVPLSCTSTSPLLAAAVRAIDSSSFIAFTVNTDLTTCLNVVVDNFSNFSPK